MNKKVIIFITVPLIIICLLAAVLFIPVPKPAYDDGGSREYVALTYKIIDWNRIYSDGVYTKTRIYFGSDRNKTIDELWMEEEACEPDKFIAEVIEINGNSVLVEPLEGEAERASCDRISFDISSFENAHIQKGTIVEICYDGKIMETYPAQIKAYSWSECNDLRHIEYDKEFMVKSDETKIDYSPFEDIVINKIYANCFFANTVIPLPYTIKINGVLPEEYCVGDQVICTCENIYYDEESDYIEADMTGIEISNLELDPMVAYKPVIYLYPEEVTDVDILLQTDGGLTCTYPAYNDGWSVTAYPDGTIENSDGKVYNYLYWEGETYARYDFSEGFCVKGEDTAEFLDEALSSLGLNRREANEFIVYWLPLMERNAYNIISFQAEEYTDNARLEITPSPDTLIRIFMAWRESDFYVDIPPQELTAPERSGFTVVEWGGTMAD